MHTLKPGEGGSVRRFGAASASAEAGIPATKAKLTPIGDWL